MEKGKSITVKIGEHEESQINEIKEKYNVTFETAKELFHFMLQKTLSDRETERIEIEVEKFIEKPIPENSILMQFNEPEFSHVNDIVEMCEIAGFANNAQELLLRLIHLCQKRGELVLTEDDKELLLKKRQNNG